MNDSAAGTNLPLRSVASSKSKRTRVMDNLVPTLIAFHEAERKRAMLIHQQVHDLGNELHLVGLAAKLLEGTAIANDERRECTALLHQSVQCATTMLDELMELARLEACEERRHISDFDGALLVEKLCTMSELFARERGLYLKTDGPPRLPVVGDPGKLRRLVHNLLRNALKYTVRGGVSVSWGQEKDSWWVMVKDTGPGMSVQRAAPIAGHNKPADRGITLEVEPRAIDKGSFCVSQSEDPATGEARMGSGEGIGLSIVKRLCGLLDANLEIASSAEAGLTVRVMLPREYQV